MHRAITLAHSWASPSPPTDSFRRDTTLGRVSTQLIKCLGLLAALQPPHPNQSDGIPQQSNRPPYLRSSHPDFTMATQDDTQTSPMSRLPFFGRRKAKDTNSPKRESDGEDENTSDRPPKWSFGVLNDKHTIEVPGEVPY